MAKFAQRKIALITGGGGGIGRAMSLAFAKAGALVAVTGRSLAPLRGTVTEIMKLGGEASAYAGDASDAASVARVVSDVVAEYGQIDILVNNAGVEGPTAAVHEIDPLAWDEVMAINIGSAFLYTRAVSRHMIQRKTGHILYISALAGGLRALPMQAPLAVSKAAMLALMRVAAVELGPYGIRVNAITPGPVTGERFERFAKRQAERSDSLATGVKEGLSSRTPSRRIQDPSDIAETALFLCTTGANIVGQSINITGGMEL